ncbi:MAG: hypothetical protein RDV48_07250 [Candidatus Eremiobacteraeota bacterium]|nr:hypothetical protein [Candidatus Eremiobacteraeota bacterium]
MAPSEDKVEAVASAPPKKRTEASGKASQAAVKEPAGKDEAPGADKAREAYEEKKSTFTPSREASGEAPEPASPASGEAGRRNAERSPAFQQALGEAVRNARARRDGPDAVEAPPVPEGVEYTTESRTENGTPHKVYTYTQDGVKYTVDVSKNSAGAEVTDRDFKKDGVNYSVKETKAADGSTSSVTTAERPDGVKERREMRTRPDGESWEVVEIERPDGVKERTSSHTYETPKSLEEASGRPMQPVSPLPGPPPSDVPVIRPPSPPGEYVDKPADELMVPPEGAERGPTQVTETETTVINPSKNPPEEVTSRSKSYQQQVYLDEAKFDAGGPITVDKEKSGLFVSYTEKSSKAATGQMVTESAQASDLRMAGKREDGKEVLFSEANSWNLQNGELATTTDVRGFTREELEQNEAARTYDADASLISAKVGGKTFTPDVDGVISEKSPPDHLRDKGRGILDSKGDADEWLGKSHDDPLDVRVTVTQSPGDDRTELVEMGDYASPQKDGKTVTRFQDSDGMVHWNYRAVTDNGLDVATQEVIEGSDYNHVVKLDRSTDGTFRMTDDTWMGEKQVAHSEQGREAATLDRANLTPEERRTLERGGNAPLYHDYTTSWSKNPNTGEDQSSYDSHRYSAEGTGLSVGHVKSLELVRDYGASYDDPPRRVEDSLSYTTDPSSEKPLSIKNESGSSSIEVTRDGKVLVNGKEAPGGGRLLVNPGDPLSSLDGLFGENSPYKDAIEGMEGTKDSQAFVGALKRVAGGHSLSSSLSSSIEGQDLLSAGGLACQPFSSAPTVAKLLSKTLPGTSVGTKATALLESGAAASLATKGNIASGFISSGTAVLHMADGEWGRAAIDGTVAALTFAGLAYPPLLIAAGVLSLGEMGYDYVKGKLDETKTEEIAI